MGLGPRPPPAAAPRTPPQRRAPATAATWWASAWGRAVAPSTARPASPRAPRARPSATPPRRPAWATPTGPAPSTARCSARASTPTSRAAGKLPPTPPPPSTPATLEPSARAGAYKSPARASYARRWRGATEGARRARCCLRWPHCRPEIGEIGEIGVCRLMSNHNNISQEFCYQTGPEIGETAPEQGC
jgi:hypothetical protein